MAVTDPVADMLARIRNANIAKHSKVDIPASKMKISLAKIGSGKIGLVQNGIFKTGASQVSIL